MLQQLLLLITKYFNKYQQIVKIKINQRNWMNINHAINKIQKKKYGIRLGNFCVATTPYPYNEREKNLINYLLINFKLYEKNYKKLRLSGLEPEPTAWNEIVLPLYHSRKTKIFGFIKYIWQIRNLFHKVKEIIFQNGQTNSLFLDNTQFTNLMIYKQIVKYFKQIIISCSIMILIAYHKILLYIKIKFKSDWININHAINKIQKKEIRKSGIEPEAEVWETSVLPLHHIRIVNEREKINVINYFLIKYNIKKLQKSCAYRDSNPTQMLGRHSYEPLYYRRSTEYQQFILVMKTSGGRIFSRNKHIQNRINALESTQMLHKLSADVLIDNLRDVKKQFNGNIAYFGQSADYFLRNMPQNISPNKIYLCDLQPQLLENTIRKIVDSKTLSNYAIRPFDEVQDDVNTIIPICCDEEFWPFEENKLDLIVSNLHLHWVNEIQVVMSKWSDSLIPDGMLIGSIFGSDTLQEMRIAFTLAENERDGGVSQHTSPFISITELGNLLSRINFTLPTIVSDRRTIGFDSVYHLMQFLQDEGENEALLQKRQDVILDTMTAMTSIYESLFKIDNETQSTFEFIHFTGWKYHESQRKPLKRGSAEVSLKSLKEELEQVSGNQLEYGEIEEDQSIKSDDEK
ncbi:hypothetical protein pb186bvf_006926 [Paramecium bursaria]